MKDFRLFDIVDFVLDEDFIRWVHNKQPDDILFWENWLTQYPDKHLIVAEATRILESIKIEQQPISEIELQGEIEKLLGTIRGQVEPAEKQPVHNKFIYGKWWLAAAALLLAFGATWYFSAKESRVPKEFAYTTLTSKRQLVEHTNTSDKPVTMGLPDGSTVELASNTRISYANKFDSGRFRDVYLSGEAFFKVIKDADHPYRVFTNEIVTKVLGTSFTVRSFEKDSVIQVTVRTGKVSVYSQAAPLPKAVASPNKTGGIILTPNQQLVYEKTEQTFQRILLEHPVMILAPEMVDQNAVYEDAPLELVFNLLRKEYGINIVYDNELLKNCTVTADLRNESFYHKMDLICKAVGASYEVIDGQVVIEASGCE